MKSLFERMALPCAIALMLMVQGVSAEDLRIIGEDKSFVTTLPSGEAITITRQMTPCAKNKGWLQPLVPEPGIVPVTEIEVLNAISDPNTILVDMRTEEWFLDATIPGSVNIPYTEVAMRMDELGCSKSDAGWDCGNAANVVGFCNGPVCPQSPTAMRAMIRDGFPAEKITTIVGECSTGMRWGSRPWRATSPSD